MKLLILGGTSQARRLVDLVSRDARFDVIVSLAGRTKSPRELPVATRVGGFGGEKGLATWIKEHGIEVVVDATHPFAAQISANVVAATKACGVALGSIKRPAWERCDGDRWIDVANAQAAAEALPAEACNVFLSLGRLELSAFCARPEHSYVARTIDPPGDIALPPDISFIRDQGPFDLANEKVLLTEHGVDVIVSKNSGGAATEAKILAARELCLPVVMIARPEKPSGVVLNSVGSAMDWLDEISNRHGDPRSERGV